ncbi:hypothetical protein [Pseudolysinimonas sp.]|uniref:hypothetical protein n=1 Tax=Pseudolysinimonas sp. TaxID=2680009 RepID=UPI003F7F607C
MATFLTDGTVPDEGIFSLPKAEAEPDEVEEVEYGITVTQPFTEVDDPAAITRPSPKRYIKPMLEAGFTVRAATTATLETQPPVKTGPNAGKPRPDKEVEHLWVLAHAPGAAVLLWFKGGSFEQARVWDAAGWPTEHFHEYKPIRVVAGKDRAGKVVETEESYQRRVRAAERMADEMNATYNDGDFWVNKAPRWLDAAGRFEEWLVDLIPTFVPRAKSNKQKQATATAVELIEIGEWVG